MAEYRHLLDLILAEYIALMDVLTKKYSESSREILLDRKDLAKALDKNKYLPSSEKLRIYKRFNMLTATGEGISKVIYDKEQKKTVRKIALNVETYKKFKELVKDFER